MKVYAPSRRLVWLTWLMLGVLGVFNLIVMGGLAEDVINQTGPAAPDASGRLSTAGIGLFTAGLYIGVCLVCTRVILRPRIVVDESGLAVVNYFQSRVLTWQEIAGFHVGDAYWGISIDLRDGTVVRANAVQKANLLTWLGRPSRADSVVAELRAELSRRHPPTEP